MLTRNAPTGVYWEPGNPKEQFVIEGNTVTKMEFAIFLRDKYYTDHPQKHLVAEAIVRLDSISDLLDCIQSKDSKCYI